MTLKDHILREYVNRITSLAATYHDHQSLRERVSHEIQHMLDEGTDGYEIGYDSIEIRNSGGFIVAQFKRKDVLLATLPLTGAPKFEIGETMTITGLRGVLI